MYKINNMNFGQRNEINENINFNNNLMNNSNNTINIFQDLLEMNQNFLARAYESQNDTNYEESIKCLEKIHKNFHTLGMMVDQIPFTPFIIRENREILSQAHLEQNKDYFPVKMNNNYEFEKNQFKNSDKKKQQKIKWSEEEQKLFLEGLELYGYKNIKKVSELVKTRSIDQVRSHLQKHQLKEKKLREKKYSMSQNTSGIQDKTQNLS